jgi:hypothetical protein
VVHNDWEENAIVLVKEEAMSNNIRHLMSRAIQNITLLAEEVVLYLHSEENKNKEKILFKV